MVTTTNATFDNQFHALMNKYKTVVSAEALFWKRSREVGSHEYGLRVQAPSIMKEFVDNINLGSDPQGFLFFNNILDLDAGNGKYNVFYNTVEDIRQRAATVQFFHSKQGSFYAEFLAKDPNKTVDYTVDGQAGKWETLEVGSACAYVKKYSDETSILVTIPVIEKRLEFEVKDNSGNHSVDAWGNVMFKDLGRLQSSSGASFADGSRDIILFYPESERTGSAHFTAMFIPMDTAPVNAPGRLTSEADSLD
ncbi:hypothetical protein HYDPIDRAFT_118882 [Hydnomerulius pinastri MD-312]|uniref:Uncharacterized protein n=1 Tax=Hydnomerulius pinastri MD-312 TaxID=994086 RepID=A0A0C9VN14_9AGAM|nr:hypothetical protein HYDPIDRAFT_118882 [Hydnomerulius pinastri MD-312]